MAALIRVRFKDGTEATVSGDYPRVWAEDIEAILDDLDSEVESTPEPTPAKETPKSVASAKEKK